MPDDPTQPSQLPGQQFAVANDSTRSQSRMAKLEERVKQLEKGKQASLTPMFRWDQSNTVSSTTDYSWTIDLPVPYYSGSGITSTDFFYWFKIRIQASGGAASGNITFSALDTQSWSYSLAAAGNFTIAAPSTAAAAASVYTASAASNSPLMQNALLLTSPFGGFSTVTLRVTRTGGGAGSTVSLEQGRLYAIIPTTFTT